MSVRYISTRGGVAPCGFEDVLFGGLAPDGGLYVPDAWPRLDPDTLDSLQGRPYAEVAHAVLSPFVGEALSEEDLRRLLADACATFRHEAVAPLRQLGPNAWLLELFHGPTLAFKDIALQLLGRLFEHFLARRREHITIIGATSGDTGAAAIHACAGRTGMTVVILHPEGRISDVQRRQMTTVAADNVHNVAIRGSFDDCQALVKAMFNDAGLRRELGLAAINSINWARIMAQAVYYVTAALALGAPWRKVAFTVPSGNFGDVYAGWVAARIGLPVAQLIVATNRNDILARFFATGTYAAGEVQPTISPSMDIQVASNFERLLFDLCGAERTAELMDIFAAKRTFALEPDTLGRARELFDAASVSEDETLATMDATLRRSDILVDPHSAVALCAAARTPADPRTPMVVLATAHPAKFPDAVRAACGISPPLPARLAEQFERPEHYAVLPAELGAVRRHIRNLSSVPA